MLACGDGSVVAEFLHVTPQYVHAHAMEVYRAHFGAEIGVVDPACTPTSTDPIVIAWRTVEGTDGNDIEALFRLRRSRGPARAVVLSMNSHGAYYYSSGLCSLIAAGRAPRIGPDTPITSANKPWLYEVTTILAGHGYLPPDSAGYTDMAPEVVAGVKAFQKAKGLAVDGVIGPDSVAAAAAIACRDGKPLATNL